jgi:hypothetical protein
MRKLTKNYLEVLIMRKFINRMMASMIGGFIIWIVWAIIINRSRFNKWATIADSDEFRKKIHDILEA